MGAERLLASRWLIVFGATTSLLVSQAPVALFTFGLFIKPLEMEFGWDRSALSTASGLNSLFAGLSVPVVGIMMDRWGVRRVLLPMIILFAVSIASLALTPASIAVFTILMAAAGGIGSGQGPIGYVKSISGWFDSNRGLALGIAMAGIGLGAALMPLYTQFLIDNFGWRYAYVGLGILVIVIALPNVFFFVREPTEAAAARSDGLSEAKQLSQANALPGLDIDATLRSYRFWLLAAAFLMVAMVVNGAIVHAVPLLTDKGYTTANASALMVAVGLSTMAGRLLSGFLVDRIFAPYVAAFFFLLPCVGMYLLLSQISPLLGLISLGLASGTEIDMIGYMTSRYFGLKRFGQIYGYMFAIFAIGAAVGAYFMGLSFVRFHSYEPAFIGFGISLLLASIFILLLGPYTYPVKTKDLTH